MPQLAAAHPASLRTATSQLLLSLAALDADALWLLLFRLAQQVLPNVSLPSHDGTGLLGASNVRRALSC